MADAINEYALKMGIDPSDLLDAFETIYKKQKDLEQKKSELEEKKIKDRSRALTNLSTELSKFSENSIKIFGEKGVGSLLSGLANFSSDMVDDVRDIFNEEEGSWEKLLLDFTNKLYSKLSDLISAAFDEFETILDYSKLSNSTTRDNLLTYGLSGAESYAFDKAKELLGISSEEDLYYMNDQEWEKFREKMTYYTDKYNNLADSGMLEKIQEYEWEMTEFEEDINYMIMEVLYNNKDTIKNMITLTIKAMEGLLNFFSWISQDVNEEVGTESQIDNAAADILSSYSVNNSAVNINQNNIYNAATQSTSSISNDVLRNIVNAYSS